MRKSAKWIAVFLSAFLIASYSASAVGAADVIATANVSSEAAQTYTETDNSQNVSEPGGGSSSDPDSGSSSDPDSGSSSDPDSGSSSDPDSGSSSNPDSGSSSSSSSQPHESSKPDSNSKPYESSGPNINPPSNSGSNTNPGTNSNRPSSGGNTRPQSSSQNTNVGGTSLLPGNEDSELEETPSQNWDQLLSGLISGSSSLAPIDEVFSEQPASSNTPNNASMLMWLGIGLIVLAVGGIGFVVYTVFFSKGKNGNPPDDSSPTPPSDGGNGGDIYSADPTSADYGDDYHYYDDESDNRKNIDIPMEEKGPKSDSPEPPQEFTQEFTKQPSTKADARSYPDAAPQEPASTSGSAEKKSDNDPFWDQFFR